MKSTTDHTTALCIVPPVTSRTQTLLTQVDEFRRQHDKAYLRWPPHINLVYPFVLPLELPEAAATLSHALHCPPLTLRFDRTKYFEHGKKSFTLYLEPSLDDAALMELQRSARRCFPRLPEPGHEFTPHMTIGTFSSLETLHAAKRLFDSKMVPVEFELEELVLIARDGNEPFSPRLTVCLADGSVEPTHRAAWLDTPIRPTPPANTSAPEFRVQEPRAKLTLGPGSSTHLAHMKLRCPPRATQGPKERTTVLLCLDRSGSMAGRAWTQVQDVIEHIVGIAAESEHIELQVVLYHDTAAAVPASQVSTTRAGGRTNFAAVFGQIRGMLQKARPVAVLFMTDGRDTSGEDYMHELESLRTVLSGMGSVVHCLGFSEEHDFNLLSTLTQTGSNPGVFQYAEPSDGPEALFHKINNVFELLVCEAQSEEVIIELPHALEFTDGSRIQGHAMLDCTLSLWVQCCCAVDSDETLTVQVCRDGEQLTIPLPASRAQGQGAELEWDTMHTGFRVQELSKAASGACLAKDLEALVQHVDHLRYQAVAQSKSRRTRILEMLSDVQRQLDMLMRVVADEQRTVNSTAVLARANEVRFCGRFSKARRQRVMDKRAVANAKEAQDLDALMQQAASLVPEELLLPEQATEMYKCMLSQCDIQDVLLDPEDFTEVLGFGLAVSRPEHVVDAPTEIRIQNISGAILSRSATMDCIQHAIGINSAALRTFSKNASHVVEAMVGSYGHHDPINAWLPLYINKWHWARARVVLRPCLGYFFTLDPLGFSSAQLSGMLMVLAQMALESLESEHAAKMFFAFWRTCIAMAEELREYETIQQQLIEFGASQCGRTKDVVASFHAFLGGLLIAPRDLQQRLLNHSTWQLAVQCEMLRRAARNLLKTSVPAVSNTILALVCGQASMPEGGVSDVLHCSAPEVSPELPQTAAVPPKYRDKKLDRAAAVLGMHAAGRVPGSKSKADFAVEQAQQVYSGKCVELMEATAGCSPHEGLESEPSAAAAVIADRFMAASNISLQDLHGLLQIANTLASSVDIDIHSLDSTHAGVAPQDWVERIRNNPPGPRRFDEAVTEQRTLCTMVGLAARYHSDGDSRSAANRGIWRECWLGDSLVLWGREFEEACAETLEARKRASALRSMNCIAVTAPELWSFCGLINAHEKRDVYMNHLYDLLADPQMEVPDRNEKVKICVTGKFEGAVVFDRGNAVLPNEALCAKLEEALGEAAWREIEMEVRSRSGWQYRCACSYVTGDRCPLANRHGHCNGHPYKMIKKNSTNQKFRK